ncbi:MAG: glyceraldehyde-3-phosphate dehydrogenase [Pseudomonadota bacterium]
MTTRLALILAAMILAAIIADVALNAGAATHFLIVRLVDFMDWLAFWR